MKQLKKTILTLVALLAVTTGAWADETLLLTIESTDNTSFKSGSKTFDDKVTVTFSSSVRNDGDGDGWFGSSVFSSLLTVTGTNGYTITSCKFYTEAGVAATGYTVEGESPSVYLSDWCVFTDASKSVNIGEVGVKKIEVYTAAPAPSGPKVAWDKDKKSGSFTMPGGNVTLEPEYYPQATLAFQGLTATVDAAAKTEAPLAVLADGAVTGGTLMYYVATDKNFSQADAIALAETQWSAAIPTAETIEAAGTYIMWYYIKGDAEHSDTDPVPLAVTLLPEPTYAVTFAEGTDPNEWTASPATDVTKGQTVTVTYSGSKKVIGVKAEKKSATVPVETITLNKTETSIKVGATETLSVTAVAPDDATDKTYTWKTSDESKATVDQDGKVTAVAAGTVTIYAEANDGSGVKGNCTVTVTPATITVTWNASDIVTVNPWDKSFTKDGITFAPGHADFEDKNFMDGGTFTTTLGNFTKIEVTAPYVDISGTGWSGGSWAGDASSSVSYSGDIYDVGMGQLKIVFTIEPTN